MDDIRKISKEEYELSIVKHEAWEQLNKFIEQKEQETEERVEFAENWKTEFFSLETKDEIRHFIKDFPLNN
jgi:hypothetical protein